MKKITIAVTALAVTLALGTGAFALSPAHTPGVCDGSAARTRQFCGGSGRLSTLGYADANGDGICDNRGTGIGNGAYVDANGDGICDNRGTGCHGGNHR